MLTTETLYDNIDAERARTHMTLAQFAEKIGMSDRTFREYRALLKPLTTTQLVNVAKVFECSTDYLLGFTDKINREG